MEEQDSTGFEVAIGGDWTKYFSDLTAVANWVQSEATAWQWASKTGTQTGSQVWSRMHTAWDAINREVQKLRSQPDAPTTSLLQALRNPAIVASESDYGSRIASLRNDDEKTAAAVLAIRVGAGIQPADLQHVGIVRGAVLAVLDAERLTSDSIAATVSSFDQTAEEIRNELAAIQGMRDAARADMDAFEQEIQASRLSFGQEFRERIAAFSEEHRKVLSTTSEDWETLRGTYDEQLSLRAPVKPGDGGRTSTVARPLCSVGRRGWSFSPP